MPSKPHDPNRLTVYLDTSTLSKAFRAHSLRSDGQYFRGFAPLFPWIEQVAKDANLVLAHIHLVELSAWDDFDAARACVQWLDELPVVWARFSSYVQDDEDEYWARTAMCDSTARPVKPFAPSMLTALEGLSVAETPTALSRPRLINLWEDERNHAPLAKQLHAWGMQVAVVLHTDRRNAGWPSIAPEKLAAVDRNGRAHLRKRAGDAVRRMQARGEPPPFTWGGVQDPFVTQYERVPKAMPLQRVTDRLVQGFASTAANRTLGSKKYNQLDSSMADVFHSLVGAAYCDVFTCDRLTSEWLGDVRTTLGLAPQLAEGMADGSTSGFVKALMASVPVPVH